VAEFIFNLHLYINADAENMTSTSHVSRKWGIVQTWTDFHRKHVHV